MLVGVPLLASPANLAFWMGLCSAWRVPGVAAEITRFREHAAQGTEQLAKFAEDYNTEMITKAGLSLQTASRCSITHRWLRELSSGHNYVLYDQQCALLMHHRFWRCPVWLACMSCPWAKALAG